MIKTIAVNGASIRDKASFHDTFARAFGFPDFYGRNFDAWIDCMSRLDEPFSAVQVTPGELVILKVEEADDLNEREPELYSRLLDLAAFVNWRRIEAGQPPILVIAAYA